LTARAGERFLETVVGWSYLEWSGACRSGYIYHYAFGVMI
jgi:hypothetical protein